MSTSRRPKWVPDDSVIACTNPDCGSEFSFFNRKHHCRSCGNIFCNNCCSALKQLPLEYGYPTPQRTCVLCVAAFQKKTQKKSEASSEATLDAQLFLRPHSEFKFISTQENMGSREDKYYFVVEENKKKMLMLFVPVDRAPFSVNSDTNRKSLYDGLNSLTESHPFLHTYKYLDYMKEKQTAVIFQEILPFSLKDKIYKQKNPFLSYEEKYLLTKSGAELKGTPLSLTEISKFGNQILEGLLYLKRLDFRHCHLSTSNILIDLNGNIKLSNLENNLFGLVPHLHPFMPETVQLLKEQEFEEILDSVGATKAIEAFTFGHVLYEMATGTNKGLDPLNATLIPKPLAEIFSLIFPSEKDAPPEITLEELYTHSFFKGKKAPAPNVLFEKRFEKILDKVENAMPNFLSWESIVEKKNKPDQKKEKEKKPEKAAPSLNTPQKKKNLPPKAPKAAKVPAFSSSATSSPRAPEATSVTSPRAAAPEPAAVTSPRTSTPSVTSPRSNAATNNNNNNNNNVTPTHNNSKSTASKSSSTSKSTSSSKKTTSSSSTKKSSSAKIPTPPSSGPKFTPPPSSGDRGGLLRDIQNPTIRLRKTKTVEKGTKVGGKVL